MKKLAARKDIEDAMWAGDINKLDEIAPCRCCCHEHTFADCPARQWNGCRGQLTMTYADEQAWARHYEKHHGMKEAAFYGYEEPVKEEFEEYEEDF